MNDELESIVRLAVAILLTVLIIAAVTQLFYTGYTWFIEDAQQEKVTVVEHDVEEPVVIEKPVQNVENNVTVPVTIQFSLFDIGLGGAIAGGIALAVKAIKKRKKKGGNGYVPTED